MTLQLGCKASALRGGTSALRGGTSALMPCGRMASLNILLMLIFVMLKVRLKEQRRSLCRQLRRPAPEKQLHFRPLPGSDAGVHSVKLGRDNQA